MPIAVGRDAPPVEVELLPALPEPAEPEDPEPDEPPAEPERVAVTVDAPEEPERVEFAMPVERAVPLLTRAVPLPAIMADDKDELAELRVAIKELVMLPAIPVALTVGAEVMMAPTPPEVALAMAELAAEGF